MRRRTILTAITASACLGLGTALAAPAAADTPDTPGQGAATELLPSGSADLLPTDSLDAILGAFGSETGNGGDNGGDGGSGGPGQCDDLTDVVADPPEKSWHDALAKAKDAFEKDTHGDVAKIELEESDGGTLHYKIELYNDGTEFAVQYGADDLELLDGPKIEQDSGDADEIFTPDELGVDLDTAAGTAREQIDEPTIHEWKIEGKDDGPTQYEFDIYSGCDTGNDAEVQIDANTGEVLSDS